MHITFSHKIYFAFFNLQNKLHFKAQENFEKLKHGWKLLEKFKNLISAFTRNLKKLHFDNIKKHPHTSARCRVFPITISHVPVICLKILLAQGGTFERESLSWREHRRLTFYTSSHVYNTNVSVLFASGLPRCLLVLLDTRIFYFGVHSAQTPNQRDARATFFLMLARKSFKRISRELRVLHCEMHRRRLIQALRVDHFVCGI